MRQVVGRAYLHRKLGHEPQVGEIVDFGGRKMKVMQILTVNAVLED